MRRTIGLAAISAALWLMPASHAHAQYGFGVPTWGYGIYRNPYGYGRPPGYGYGGFRTQYNYGYGIPYGGYSSAYSYAPGIGVAGTNVYSSGYSSFVAPGAVGFSSGYYAPAIVPYSVGIPAFGMGGGYNGSGYGYGGYGYGGGYGPTLGYPVGRYGSVATSPFMGLPRPNAGLIRIP